jgi:cytochrome P450
MILLLALLLSLTVYTITCRYYTNLPYYPGWIPIIGHILSLNNIEKVIQYGDQASVFVIQIFSKKIAFVCDIDIITEYFKQGEGMLSLYQALKNLYFGDAFSDKEDMFNGMIHVIRKSIQMQTSLFVPKMLEEAKKTVMRIAPNKTISLQDIAIRFVSDTSASCFIGTSLTDNAFNRLQEFSHQLNSLVVLTYFMPKYLIKLLWGSRLRKYRILFRNEFNDIIGSYIDDPALRDALFVRKAVDFYLESGYSRDDIIEYVGDIVVCLMYVSTENTALGVSNMLYDIIRSGLWDKVKAEVTDHVLMNDTTSIFTNTLLNNIVWESARMNTHAIPIHRVPISKKIIGEYDFTGIDTISISSAYLMKYGKIANELFPNPEVFDPSRYDDNPQLKNIRSIITWGFGVHTCPGKNFAIYEMLAATAYIVASFDEPIIVKDKPINLFSTSAFGSKEVDIIVPDKTTLHYSDNSEYISISGSSCRLYQYGDIYHIKRILDDQQTEELFGKLSGSAIITPSGKYVLHGYTNNVYTGTSNMDIPIELLNLSTDLYKECKEVTDDGINSMYCMSMSDGMCLHTDEHVEWGISISIGSSCEFEIDGKKMILENGDIVVANFGKYIHGVNRIIENTMPGWYEHSTNYGMKRFTIQLRNVSKFPEPITMDQFIMRL